MFQDVIYVVVGIVAAQAETDCAFGEGLLSIHRGEDVAGFDGAGRAGGTAGDADVEAVEEEEDAFGFDAGEGDVGGVGKAGFLGAIAGGVGNVAEGARRGAQLSAIYGGADYLQADAEEEVFAQSEVARRKRLGLSQQEEAMFSGQSGVGKSTLAKGRSY